jgi:hypothetical protein
MQMGNRGIGRDALVQVTEDSIDPLFNDPYIDVNELRERPVPHRYVHGGFKGTDARFSFYFPPAAQYQGRFHHNTYPLATTEDIGPFPIAFEVATGNLGFTLESGGYYVQTNMGGAFRRGEPSIAAYRVNAAAAKYSRVIAAEVYGAHRPFGYLYGGSGGAYQTIGGAEHTSGVWDGFMPFVLGSNNAVPSLWSVRLNALRVLRKRDMFPVVMDAINPGGSGDIYGGLNEEERAALKEATSMGFPPRAWYNHETLHNGYFSDVFGVIPPLDPTYADDFWTKPGYLGSNPKSSIAADRFEFETTVARVVDGPPKRVTLANVPDKDLGCVHLVVLGGAAAGNSLHIATADGNTLGFATTSNPAVVSGIRAGDKVRIDNSWILAAQTYQRHQVPPSSDEYGWNQFRDSAGNPIYPQRDVLIGHTFAVNSIGSLLTGRILGKMLLVQALMDIDALPWCADWYRSEVKKALGPGFAENLALWFIDHAQHDNPATSVANAHTVGLDGPLQQGLRDLSQWVEKGVRPSDTKYTVIASQVLVPQTAGERGGIQATVELKANGSALAKVRTNESVAFSATVDVPSGAGHVLAAEWDFEGVGNYCIVEQINRPQPIVSISSTHAYDKPGTYYAVLRATSQRNADAQTPYGRIQNIARVRVVVS